MPAYFRFDSVGVENDSISDFYLTGFAGGQTAAGVHRYPDAAAAMAALAEGEAIGMVASFVVDGKSRTIVIPAYAMKDLLKKIGQPSFDQGNKPVAGNPAGGGRRGISAVLERRWQCR